MHEQALISIAKRLAEADLLDIIRADPVAWPDADVGQDGAIPKYIDRFEAGARIILGCCDWHEPVMFWADSVDGQKTAINQDWSPKPRDRIKANRAGMMEQYLRDGLPTFVRSARWLALDIMCAIADMRHAIEVGAPAETVHSAGRLSWSLCELSVMFNYAVWLDRSVRSYSGSKKGARRTKEAREHPLRDEIMALADPMIAKGLSTANIAGRLHDQLVRAKARKAIIPSTRTIRSWVGMKKAGRKTGHLPTTQV